ncbi:arogenate dehydratase [Aureococcus anophagefferens]|nr:arogenate dehydratase [Aureococcus anophagefferens]
MVSRRNRSSNRVRRVAAFALVALPGARAFRPSRLLAKQRLRTHALQAEAFGAHGSQVDKPVAFQGEHGAYSEEACFQHFGDTVTTLPCASFEELFAAVESGEAAYGVLPMENSQAGSINKAYDLLMDFDLRVHGETILRVQHSLLALPRGPDDPPAVRVRSHPQALAQCERYISANGLTIEAGSDTAGSAKEIAADGELEVAAICSKFAATRYGLEVLALGIEDYKFNFTRFFILAKGDASPPLTIPKTSVIFAVGDKPGALCAALEEFSKRNVNLVMLESRPRRRTAMPGFNYIFYLDFEGHHTDEPCRDAIVGLLSSCAFVKLLGSYDAAPPVVEQLANAEDTTVVNDPSLMQI